MEDLAIGRLLRELRIRLGWPQAEVADRARISRSAYSELERGRFDGVPLPKLRKVAAVLEVRLVLEARWRGAAIDRVVSSRHAAMAERLTQMLLDVGFEVRPEVSFSVYGERGVVDLVGWHAASRTLLLVEVKTELADVNNLLEVTNRRVRLGPKIANPFEWRPTRVSSWVVLASSRTNQRRVAAHRAMLRAAFPQDGRAVRGFLADPSHGMCGLWFLPDSSLSSTRRASAPRLRVRRTGPSVPSARNAA